MTLVGDSSARENGNSDLDWVAPDPVVGELTGSEASIEAARTVIEGLRDPETGLRLGDLGMVPAVEPSADGGLRVTLALAPAQYRSGETLSDTVADALTELGGMTVVEVVLTGMTEEEEHRAAEVLRNRQPKDPPYFTTGGTKVVLVTSGKGGVGKSTVSVNLACALAARGRSVGLLDADVWGYSVPRMLGSSGDPTGIGELLLPERVHGVRAVSIGFLADEESPVVWRGPMLHEAVAQFVADVFWGDLDMLVVDLPPGTGDVAISLASLLPGANVVVVTTPQEVAYHVAARAGLMAARAKLRLAGVVENLSGYVCAHCGEPNDIFGASGGQELSERLGVPLLGRVPISPALREAGDTGEPLVLSTPDDPAAQALAAVATEIDRRARGVLRRRLGVPLLSDPIANPTTHHPNVS